ncbi:MAG: hypothetical protein AAF664_08455 [Planctomycetota bacterium]
MFYKVDDESIPVGTSKTWKELADSVKLVTYDNPDFRVTIKGRVVNTLGESVQGGKVFLRENALRTVGQLGPGGRQRLGFQEGEMVTSKDVVAATAINSNGEFEILNAGLIDASPPPVLGMSWDILAITEDGHLGWRSFQGPRLGNGFHRFGPPPPSQTDFEIVVKPTNTIKGVVQDDQGEPLSDVSVVVSTLSPLDRERTQNTFPIINSLGLFGSQFESLVRTDQEGRFTAPGVPQDHTARVIVFDRQQRFAFDSLVVSGEASTPNRSRSPGALRATEALTVRPSETEDIEVHLIDKNGNPLPNVHLVGFGTKHKSDANGIIRAKVKSQVLDNHAYSDNGNHKQLRLTFRPPQGRAFVQNFRQVSLAKLTQKDSNDPLVVRLELGRRVTGRVIDRDDGTPVKNAKLWFEFTSNPPGGNGLAAAPFRNYSTSFSDASGHFEFTVGYEQSGFVYVAESLTHQDAGGHNGIPASRPSSAIEVTASGPGVESLELPTIKVPRRSSLRVQCTDSQGHAIPNAIVECTGYKQYSGGRGFAVPGQNTTSAISDAEGVATVARPESDTDHVQVIAYSGNGRGSLSGRVKFNVNNDDDICQVEMIQRVRLSGFVFANDEPLEGVSVRLTMFEESPNGLLGLSFTSHWLEVCKTNAKGMYEFYTHANQSYASQIISTPADLKESSQPSWRVDVGTNDHIFPAIKLVTKIEAEGRLAIKVIDESGQPLKGFGVQWNRYKNFRPPPGTASPENAVTDDSGYALLIGLYPEAMQLWVFPPETLPGLPPQSIDVEPNVPVTVRFDTSLTHERRVVTPLKTIPRDEVELLP